MSPIEGAYEGPDGVRRFFADVRDAGPDFRLTIDRLESVGADRVLGLLRITVSGRTSGISLGSDTPTGNAYDLVDGKIRRIRIFLDRQKALEAVGLAE